MTEEELAGILYREVAETNIQSFLNRYFDNNPERISNIEFKKTIEFTTGLSDIQKSALRDLIKQVSIDTASTVLGIVQGSHVPDEIEGEFTLLYEGKNVGRDIQAHFLAEDERAGGPL